MSDIPRANYTIDWIEGIVLITDLNLGGMSVTNDAEAVIADLAITSGDLSRVIVLYRDSAGDWAELRTHNGRFAGFQALGDIDRDKALGWARSEMLLRRLHEGG